MSNKQTVGEVQQERATIEVISQYMNEGNYIKAAEILNQYAQQQKQPTDEESKSAMLRRKTKFIADMPKFGTRKQAYKSGWRDCLKWARAKYENK